jgi:hypothetical protein
MKRSIKNAVQARGLNLTYLIQAGHLSVYQSERVRNYYNNCKLCFIVS